MTPSNPDNSQPLIYRIADALGVFHLVAPVNHTHSQAEIDGLAAALAGKQNILNFDTTPTAGSTNPVTSGGVKTALNGKANANHGHESIGGTGSAQDAYVECNQDIVKISAEGEVIIEIQGQAIHLTVDNYDNLVRALTNPDSTPTASSDNLITSGAVAAALTRSVLIITSNIDVEGLPVGKIIPVSYFNTSNEAKNLYDIFSFDNVTTQYKRLAINTEDVEIQSSGRAVAFIMKETNESGLGIITTLHVWYQGAGRIVNIE